jgi:hypothetical protein
VQGIFRADIIALGAVDALGDVYPDLLRLLEELDGVGRADPQAEGAADACFPVVDNFSTEFRGCRHGWMDASPRTTLPSQSPGSLAIHGRSLCIVAPFSLYFLTTRDHSYSDASIVSGKDAPSLV